MKISLNWINDYVDIAKENKQELADKITKSGINVEQVESLNLDNLIIGEVVECNPHPDSDHLNVCKVNIGEEIIQIVCGASNVKKDIKVIVALPKCILPGGFEIKKSTIRGIESNGMICALFELGLEEKNDENYNKGIYILDDDAPISENPIKYLGLDDTIYTLDLNPNRNDCLSHIGFAYVAASVLGKKVVMPNTKVTNEIGDISTMLDMTVETDNCPLYTAKIVTDVTIKESPDFIKNRLINAGMRPINNVVDISNYIMLEYGQPLHFFDKDKVKDHISVRMAKNNERITTLDDQTRTLCEDDIIITDGNKPIAIAGVMGGKDSEIDSETKNIIIESAIFNPYNIRYTSKKLDLRSEASLRFEKTLNFEYTYLALARACYLLEKYADGKVIAKSLVHDKYPKTDKIKEISIEKINSVLGTHITKNDIDKAFDALDFNYEFKDNSYKVTIPNRRMDVSISEDLIEEVGCLYGYDNIEGKLPVLEVKQGNYSYLAKLKHETSRRMTSLGLSLVETYTLISENESQLFKNNKEFIKLLLPMSSDKSIIRTTLLPSLLNVYNYNSSRGVTDIKIFEIANTYYKDNGYKEELLLSGLLNGNYITSSWNNNGSKIDFYYVKGLIESLFNYLGFENRYSFRNESLTKEMHPFVSAKIYIDNQEVGFFGKVHPNTGKEDIYVFEMSLSKISEFKTKSIKYVEPNRYPEISKDLAFIINKDISSEDIIKTIKKNGSKLLKEVSVFDLYIGDKIEKNSKSLAFKLVFSDNSKTLTQEEVDLLFNKIIKEVELKHNAVLRNS